MYPERLPQPLQTDETGRYLIDPYTVALKLFNVRIEHLKDAGVIRQPSHITSDEELDDHFDDLWREYRQVCREMDLAWPPAQRVQAGGVDTREEKPEGRVETDGLAEILSQEYQDWGYLAFEGNLAARGWLPSLEQAGILPVTKYPKPRERALKRLYIGAILGDLDEQLLIIPTLIFSVPEKEVLVDTVNQDGVEAVEDRGSRAPERLPEPDLETLQEWESEGNCEATDGCVVEPDGVCPHGCQSWLLELGLI